MERGENSLEHKVLYVILATLCATALILGVIIIAKNLNNKSQTAETQDTTSTETQESETTNAELDNYINEMEEKIQSAGTNEEKAELLMERAKGTYDICSGRFEEYKDIILSDTYTAEQISPSAESAYLIYKFESELRNEDFANQYLELARERGANVENVANE